MPEQAWKPAPGFDHAKTAWPLTGRHAAVGCERCHATRRPDAVDAAVNHVCHRLRTLGEREVPARLVGELVMDELHKLDEVAYVRFASVYRSFQDVDAFREEIEKLRHRRPRSAEDLQLGLWSQPEPGNRRK